MQIVQNSDPGFWTQLLDFLGGVQLIILSMIIAGYELIVHVLRSRADKELSDGIDKNRSELRKQDKEFGLDVDKKLENYKGQVSNALQKFKSRLNKQEIAVQAAFEKRVYVSKIRFDLELQAYREIWKTMFDVYEAVSVLRPKIDTYSFIGKSFDERQNDEEFRKRIEEVWSSFGPFLNHVYKLRPFYSKELYEKLHDLRNLMLKETLGFQLGDPAKDDNYWEKATENIQNILAMIDDICDLIRARISEVDISEDTLTKMNDLLGS